jgi:hypothetical protein
VPAEPAEPSRRLKWPRFPPFGGRDARLDLQQQRIEAATHPVIRQSVLVLYSSNPCHFALLGAGVPVLDRLEKVSPSGHSRNRGSLASRGFRLYWSLLSKARKQVGRKKLSTEVRELIFRMVAENSTWGGAFWVHTPRKKFGRGKCLRRCAQRHSTAAQETARNRILLGKQ